jgi:single-strand DNA-binding protein
MNRRWTSETGEVREETTFVEVEAWGPQAETISKYVKKGSPLLVEGRLRMDQWDDKQTGQKRTRLVVVCENAKFVGAPPRDIEGLEPSKPEAASQEDIVPPEDDVPF